MHAEPTDCPSCAIASGIERLVMLALLSSGYSAYTRAELQREVSGARGEPLDITDAIESLHAAGLVNVAGRSEEAARRSRCACGACRYRGSHFRVNIRYADDDFGLRRELVIPSRPARHLDGLLGSPPWWSACFLSRATPPANQGTSVHRWTALRASEWNLRTSSTPSTEPEPSRCALTAAA
jgi:hypothetical protein